MPQVTYWPERGAEDDCTQFGYEFANKKPTEVPETDVKALAKFRGNPFFEVEGGDVEPPGPAGSATLEAVHTGFGRYVIKRGEAIIKEGLNKADADAFNGLTDEEKEALLA